MKALLIDDHAVFVQGMQLLLQSLDPHLVCTTATRLADGLACPGPFDWVMLDYRMPDTQGCEGLARVRQAHPEAAVIVVSGLDDPAAIRALIDQGASGFVSKSADPAELTSALQTILAGGVALPRMALGGARKEPPRPPADVLNRLLPPRQRACVLMLAQGKSNKAMAKALGLEPSSVKSHLSAAFRALGVANRTEAVFRAAAWGLLPDPNPDATEAGGAPAGRPQASVPADRARA